MTRKADECRRHKEVRNEVGYKNPPRDNRFQKGTSGNPKGRPRRQLAPADSFRKVFSKLMKATIDGKQISLDGTEAGFWKLRGLMLKGDLGALRLFLAYCIHFGFGEEEDKANAQLQGLFDALMQGPVDKK